MPRGADESVTRLLFERMRRSLFGINVVDPGFRLVERLKRVGDSYAGTLRVSS